MTPTELSQLYRKIDRYFNEEELKSICFDLGVDYDNLPAEGKGYKARELVALVDRSNQVERLVSLCRDARPDVIWTFQAKLFIGYKQSATADSHLATYLYDYLTAAGHDVFIDRRLRTGTEWLDEIDKKIGEADFFIALLSEASGSSEMLKAEVQRAYSYRKRQGNPQILPVRVRYREMLPYSIEAYLNSQQYVLWEGEGDEERVGQAILDGIAGGLPDQIAMPVEFDAERHELSVDGQLVDKFTVPPPLPEVDPRILETLQVPGGAVRLSDRLYIRREFDAYVERQAAGRGTITTIRAPRQTGKSSLMIRGEQYAREHGIKVVHLDMQLVDEDHLESLDDFLYFLGRSITRKLGYDTGLVDQAWERSLGAKGKLNYLMEDKILPQTRQQILIAIDEADLLLSRPYHSDFFAMLRAWYNNAAHDPIWEGLNLMMVISTEPYLLIDDPRQSPFNIGLTLYLEDFKEDQVRELNQKHNNPVSKGQFPELMALLQGHPYLTRKALYALVLEGHDWNHLVAEATSDQGPFGDHLRYHLWLLQRKPELREALAEVLEHGTYHDERILFRLSRAGLIKGSGDRYECRCELYQRYFREHLTC